MAHVAPAMVTQSAVTGSEGAAVRCTDGVVTLQITAALAANLGPALGLSKRRQLQEILSVLHQPLLLAKNLMVQ